MDRLSARADTLPEDEDRFVGEMVRAADLGKVRLDQYGLAAAAG
jgi:hypothetical protein